MSLMYKAYLYDKKVNKPKEIRRFSVDHDVSSCYEYLRKKVASVFPDLSEENFSLQWQDSEGDLIWFNSDEELIEALSEHQGGLFKLLIKEKSNEPDTPTDDKDESEAEESNKKCGGRGGRGKWWGKRGPRGGYWCNWPGYQQHMYNQMFAQQGGPKKENESNGKDGNNGPTSDGPQVHPSGEEYLKHVGSAVSDFLKPFGIDVDVSVDHNGVRTSCSTRNPQKEEAGNDEEQKPTCSKNADEKSASKPADEKNEGSERTPSPPAPFTVPVKVVHEKKMKNDVDMKQDNQGNQSSDEGEWTLVKDEDGKSSTSEEKKETKNNKEGSNQNNSNGSTSGLPRQPGPLDLLLAMGFKDENDSLARLLQACQNDIGKVLENMEKMNIPK